MKQLFRSKLPPAIQEKIEGHRFIVLQHNDTDAFNPPALMDSGNDPVALEAQAQAYYQARLGTPNALRVVLYRVDELPESP